LEQLGLPPLELKQKSKGLLLVQFNELERWDFFSTDIRISNTLVKSNYPIQSIGSIYKIAKRTWNKRNEKAKTFRYVEIGAIDPIKGIIDSKELLVSKAPSRATQIIKENDLLIGTTRPYLKKFAIVTSKYNNNICSSGFTVFEPSKEYYLPFLMQFLKCSYGVEQLKNKMTGGLYPAITESELKEVKILFPEVTTQKLIIEKVKEKEKNILTSKIEADRALAEAKTKFEETIFDHYED
jgi:type I restriction enzyme S subunit